MNTQNITVHTEHLRCFPGFLKTICGVLSMTFQDLVRRVEVLVFNTVNATFAAYCYGTLYKLLCHFASNVSVITKAANYRM